jgi:hypothetical protein
VNEKNGLCLFRRGTWATTRTECIHLPLGHRLSPTRFVIVDRLYGDKPTRWKPISTFIHAERTAENNTFFLHGKESQCLVHRHQRCEQPDASQDSVGTPNGITRNNQTRQ